MNKLVSILLILSVLSPIFTAPPSDQKPIEFPTDLTRLKAPEPTESPARRAEIVFLISLPFTAIMSFLLLNGIYLVSDPAYNFTISLLPPEIIPFTVLSSLISSGMIAYNDYYEQEKKRQQSTSQMQDTDEFKMGLRARTNF